MQPNLESASRSPGPDQNSGRRQVQICCLFGRKTSAFAENHLHLICICIYIYIHDYITLVLSQDCGPKIDGFPHPLILTHTHIGESPMFLRVRKCCMV